ncbi:hypothetical protein [Rhizorhabdus wittichii]|uniref:hypothetical protein n=1 Tax=Rhizorhabdus wittichii TaxID=160791 RepID=UPI001ABF69BE|nr:hypothetical protein [Rhizorhabdus wittichii]
MPSFPTDVTGLPAGRKVLLRLIDVLTAAAAAEDSPGHGLLICCDRPFAQPFTPEETEVGGLHVRMGTTNFTRWDQSHLIHACEFAFDIATAEGELNSINARQAAIVAWLIGVLHADITLGGLTRDLAFTGVTPDEEQGADAGLIMALAQIQWITPDADFLTIIGPLGPIS